MRKEVDVVAEFEVGFGLSAHDSAVDMIQFRLADDEA